MSTKPPYRVLAVKEVPDGDHGTRTVYCRIGAAWPLKIKNGLSVVLDAAPLNDRLVIIEADDEEPALSPAATSKKERAP